MLIRGTTFVREIWKVYVLSIINEVFILLFSRKIKSTLNSYSHSLKKKKRSTSLRVTKKADFIERKETNICIKLTIPIPLHKLTLSGSQTLHWINNKVVRRKFFSPKTNKKMLSRKPHNTKGERLIR